MSANTGNTNRSPKIFWNDEEKKLFVKSFLEAQTLYPEDGFAKLAARAQKVLPVSRQRPETGLLGRTMLPWFDELHARIVKELEQEELDAISAMNAEADIKADKVEEVLNHAKTIEALVEKFVDDFSETLADTLVAKIAQKVKTKLQDVTPESLQAGREVKITQVALPKVLVVGPKSVQLQELQKEYEGKFRIRGWKDGQTSRLNEIAQGMDHVVLMTGFISHNVSEILTRNLAKSKILMANGGVTGVKNQLNSLVSMH